MMKTVYTFFLKSGRVLEADRYTKNAKQYWLTGVETSGRSFAVAEVDVSDVEVVAETTYGHTGDVPF